MKKIITRLSFNSNGWHRPSGAIGKSKNPIHEHIYGFGFEEWLFNKSLITKDNDGAIWHFGYIEGIQKNYRKGDEKHPLHLYTIDARLRKRYMVAEIMDWKVINSSESVFIINNNQNLIDEMKTDLKMINNPNAIGKFTQHMNNQNNHQLFNIKFKKYKYHFENTNPLPNENRIYKLNRFWLYR